MTDHETIAYAAGVTLKALRDGGVTWSIAVPAVAADERDELSQRLDGSVAEALRIHARLCDEFPSKAKGKTGGDTAHE